VKSEAWPADNTKVPHTLLLADDSVTIQRVIELTFADEDVEVVAVGNGDEAIERLDAAPPDIVLADVSMPGKNGYEVAQYIKSSPRLAHIPVVLLTGAFEPVDQVRVLKAGCEGVLSKPFEPPLVIDWVKDLLARSRQDAPVADAPAHDRWSSAPVDREPPAQHVAPSRLRPALSDLDSYFDRLDSAFADRNSAPDLPKAAPAPPPAVRDEIDWFGSTRSEKPAADLPLASAPPPPRPAMTPVLPEPSIDSAPAAAVPPESQTPPAMAATQPLPSLVDAFAALLAAEQGEPTPTVAPSWPAAAAAPAALSDDLVEAVTRRVLDRLSDHRVVRETVADVVSSIAERLVREEIERIKSSIK